MGVPLAWAEKVPEPWIYETKPEKTEMLRDRNRTVRLLWQRAPEIPLGEQLDTSSSQPLSIHPGSNERNYITVFSKASIFKVLLETLVLCGQECSLAGSD